jgi:hypothetical protein
MFGEKCENASVASVRRVDVAAPPGCSSPGSKATAATSA